MDKATPAAVIDAPKPTAVNGTEKLAPASVNPKPAAASDTDKKTEEGGKYSIRKVGKILMYAFLAMVALFLVKYEFLTPPEVVVAQVKQQDFAGEVQGTGTVNVDG